MSHRPLRSGILLALLLAACQLPLHRAAFRGVAEAGGLDSAQSRKGIVTAKVERTLTIREGAARVLVALTDATQVAGQRASADRIAVGDIVRVDGRMTPEGRLVAGRIEVLFAAGTAPGASQPPASPLRTLWSVIVNGGVSVSLP